MVLNWILALGMIGPILAVVGVWPMNFLFQASLVLAALKVMLDITTTSRRP